MTSKTVKTAFALVLSFGLLAGCATSADRDPASDSVIDSKADAKKERHQDRIGRFVE